MSKFDGLADIVVDAATRASDKAVKPLDDRIKRMGNAIDSIDRISREALSLSDEAKADLANEVEARGKHFDQIQEVFSKFTNSFADVADGLMASQDRLKQDYDSLPDPAKMVKKESLARLTQVTKLRADFAQYVEQLEQSISDVAAGQETIDDMVRALPTEMHLKIDAARSSQEERMEKIVGDFSELRTLIDDRVAEFESVQTSVVDEGRKAIEDMRKTASEAIAGLQDGKKGDPGLRGPKGDVGTMASPERWNAKTLWKTGMTVTHRGGCWYCEATTTEEPGESPAWKCIMNGIHQEACYTEDGVHTQVMSDGRITEFRVMPKHCGVYVEKDNYKHSDQVTWNGSLYQSKVDNPDQHPGKKLKEGVEPQWACLVQRGGKGPKGSPGNADDAAAIVHEQMQVDLAIAVEKMKHELAAEFADMLKEQFTDFLKTRAATDE